MNGRIALVIQNKLHRTVAKSAITIVKNYWEIHGLKIVFNDDFLRRKMAKLQIAHLANLEIWRKPLGENSKNNLLRFNNQKLSQNSPKSQTPQLPYNSQPHKTVFLSR